MALNQKNMSIFVEMFSGTSWDLLQPAMVSEVLMDFVHVTNGILNGMFLANE